MRGRWCGTCVTPKRVRSYGHVEARPEVSGRKETSAGDLGAPPRAPAPARCAEAPAPAHPRAAERAARAVTARPGPAVRTTRRAHRRGALRRTGTRHRPVADTTPPAGPPRYAPPSSTHRGGPHATPRARRAVRHGPTSRADPRRGGSPPARAVQYWGDPPPCDRRSASEGGIKAPRRRERSERSAPDAASPALRADGAMCQTGPRPADGGHRQDEEHPKRGPHTRPGHGMFRSHMVSGHRECRTGRGEHRGAGSRHRHTGQPAGPGADPVRGAGIARPRHGGPIMGHCHRPSERSSGMPRNRDRR